MDLLVHSTLCAHAPVKSLCAELQHLHVKRRPRSKLHNQEWSGQSCAPPAKELRSWGTKELKRSPKLAQTGQGGAGPCLGLSRSLAESAPRINPLPLCLLLKGVSCLALSPFRRIDHLVAQVGYKYRGPLLRSSVFGFLPGPARPCHANVMCVSRAHNCSCIACSHTCGKRPTHTRREPGHQEAKNRLL